MTELNESLQLNVYGDEKIFPLGSEIELRIKNHSPNSIFFAGDSHIKLFAIKDTEWVEVQNKLTYSGSILLSPQGTPALDVRFTKVKPVLDENIMNTDQKDIPLRIVMIGGIMENENPSGKLVGAYVDVYITP